MPKIVFIKLYLNGDNFPDAPFLGDIIVKAKLKFSREEIQSKLQFQLHYFLYSAQKSVDTSQVSFEHMFGMNDFEKGKKCYFLSYGQLPVVAKKSTQVIENNIEIELKGRTFYRGLKIFGLLLPIDQCASNWSSEYFFDIVLH